MRYNTQKFASQTSHFLDFALFFFMAKLLKNVANPRLEVHDCEIISVAKLCDSGVIRQRIQGLLDQTHVAAMNGRVLQVDVVVAAVELRQVGSPCS